MNFGFVDPWHRFLPREGGHVISVMGSGGKTSLLKVLARFYKDLGLTVILTTTTRTEPLTDWPAFEWSRVGDLEPVGLEPVFFVRGGPEIDGKWSGLAPETVDELGGLFPERVVVCEVDGSAKLPVKLHRQEEPVWPARTSLALIVMGTGAVGSATEKVLHRFGRMEWPALGDLRAWTVWEWDHLATLLLEPGGYLSRVPEGLPCVLALTGMDEQADSIGLFDFVGRVMADPRLPLAMFCDLAADPAVIRTVCKLEGEEG